ncbi:MAG: TonB-dependent receptor [Bacteroidaceae bacterium]|nr:TonB-dependent receptor [Bacteroidaceae bacterium]
MQTHFRMLAATVLLAAATTVGAQTVVKGKLVDADNGEPLVGAQVRIVGDKSATVTNAEGEFSLQNPRRHREITVSYLGFKTQNFSVSKSGQMGTLGLSPDEVMLEGVTVSGTMAFDRKTPVALSNVTAEDIEERLGGQEFPEVLKTTPGVHANKQGGGWGDSEIWMRGFDNTNVATMVNGVPMNDMENGTVYWSNWAGISDVARIVQTQRGLGASKVSAPSVGGTINILTRTLDQKRGGSISYQMGNNGANKVTFNVSTGMSKRGWGLTLLGTRQWGDGYVQGTDYSGYTWFASLAKKFNERHALSFTGFGTIQEHGQRTSSQNYGPLTLSEWARVRQQYGFGYQYNPTFGRLNGKDYNALRNKYHKPQLSLNHDWTINDHSSLSTALYMSIGRGNGTTGEGFAGGSYTDIRGASYGQVLNTFRNADGTFDYDALYERNAASEVGSMFALANSQNNHLWTGLLSTYQNHINEHWDLTGGLDFRYYNGTHKTVVKDLFGGQYFIDYDQRSKVDPALKPIAADPAWQYEKLGVGDVVYRNYDGYVVQEGIFGQAEYNVGGLSAYANGGLNNITYWQRNHYYYEKAQEKSDNVNFLGGNIKGGANYNFNDYHNVFFNVGYISRAPKYNAAFMKAETSNMLNKDAKNEKILSFEVGYGLHWNWLNLKVNAYYTKWMDKSMSKYIDAFRDPAYINMTGVDARHMGIELEGKLEPAKWVTIKGMLSLGDWQWCSNAEGYVYDERGQALTADGTRTTVGAADHAKANIDLDGIRVGGAAQTTASLGADFKLGRVLGLHDGQELKIGADWVYYGRNYSYYSFSGTNLTIGKTYSPSEPWKVPSASQVDLHASYRFKIGNHLTATLSGNVNNLFDYQYIGKAYNPSSGVAAADNIYAFYNFGRTYTIRLKLAF